MVTRYLTLMSLEQARSVMKNSFPIPSRTEKVPIMQAAGRVMAAPVHAKYSVPEANIAAMDGIAVRSSDTTGASEQSPVTLDHFARVNTGNIIPREFNAVIMIEDTWQAGDRYQIRKAAVPNQHIRPAGEDIRENQLVLPEGHLVRPFDIGALATYGITHVEARAVAIGIIPTGSELVPLGVRPIPGQVVESNTIMAQVFLTTMGAHCTRYPIIRDDPDLIAEGMKEAVRENDLVLISAGSSAGTRDFTAGVIGSLGELLFHGVAIRPGKPVMLGKIAGKPVIGLPGYPLAAQTVLREFVVPLLESWGFAPVQRNKIRARLSRAIVSDPGFDDFIPVYTARVGRSCWCVPHVKGSGVQMATVRANGYIHVPAPLEGCEADTDVDIILTTDPKRIDRTLLITGSLDPSLEDLANIVHNKGLFVHASDAGSTGALISLNRRSCHAALLGMPAFSSLPDCRFLLQHMPKDGLVYVHIATIGTGIASRNDLDKEDIPRVRWINTRKDSAYRMLLDAVLAAHKIDRGAVQGYDNEANGPSSVAEAICNGIADAGICTAGIAAAAGLRFIPTGSLQYGLAILPEMMGDSKIRSLVSAIQSPEYREHLSGYAGYDIARTGSVRQFCEDHTVREITEDPAVRESTT